MLYIQRAIYCQLTHVSRGIFPFMFAVSENIPQQAMVVSTKLVAQGTDLFPSCLQVQITFLNGQCTNTKLIAWGIDLYSSPLCSYQGSLRPNLKQVSALTFFKSLMHLIIGLCSSIYSQHLLVEGSLSHEIITG